MKTKQEINTANLEAAAKRGHPDAFEEIRAMDAALDAAEATYWIRFSTKRADEMCDLGAALACEDGEDYSAWPVAKFHDGSEIDLITEGGNMTEREAIHAVCAHFRNH